MSFFNKAPLTEQQKRARSQQRMNLRLLACVFLVYTAIQLLRTPTEEGGLSPAMQITAAVGFIVFALVFILLTIRDKMRLAKSAKEDAVAEQDSTETEDEDSAGDEDDEEYDDEYEDDEDYDE